ncbi:NADPH-dependent FMN reductase [Tumidithrix elongata RA019]|uniref:NADPH-dependent FMN reductase n=1 Tax=Tumidithrix elongata BACA0141 TaxID=2716417 RepID=A0AAW9Q7E6_9CYAN|nr:NADPH-dependent FMN reductase [Tumidithrix elongata RA019]
MSSILLISGSPSHPSRTYGLLEYVNTYLQKEGITTNILSVRDLPAEDLIFGQYNSSALEVPKELLANAAAVVIATPIYKASYTGVLKTFLDLLPQKALEQKVVLPLATGGTIAHLLATEFTLKPVLAELGARHILGTVYAVDKQLTWAEDGSLQIEAEIEQRLQTAIADFVKIFRSIKA